MMLSVHYRPLRTKAASLLFRFGLVVAIARPLCSTYGYIDNEALMQVSRGASHFDWPMC